MQKHIHFAVIFMIGEDFLEVVWVDKLDKGFVEYVGEDDLELRIALHPSLEDFETIVELLV